MEKIPNLKKNEKEKNKFSDVEKRQLISAVKKSRHIWDKTQKLHSNRTAMKAAWKVVAKEIGKTGKNKGGSKNFY